MPSYAQNTRNSISIFKNAQFTAKIEWNFANFKRSLNSSFHSILRCIFIFGWFKFISWVPRNGLDSTTLCFNYPMIRDPSFIQNLYQYISSSAVCHFFCYSCVHIIISNGLLSSILHYLWKDFLSQVQDSANSVQRLKSKRSFREIFRNSVVLAKFDGKILISRWNVKLYYELLMKHFS